MQFDEAGRREDRGLDRGLRPCERQINRRRDLVDGRLGASADLQHATDERRAGAARAQRRGDERVEHREQLARRPGQRGNRDVGALEQQPGRAAERIGPRPRARGHECLPPVDAVHRDGPGGKARLQRRDDRRVLAHGRARKGRERVAREVVGGRAKAAGDDDEIRARRAVADGAHDVGDAVAGDGLVVHIDHSIRVAALLLLHGLCGAVKHLIEQGDHALMDPRGIGRERQEHLAAGQQ